MESLNIEDLLTREWLDKHFGMKTSKVTKKNLATLIDITYYKKEVDVAEVGRLIYLDDIDNDKPMTKAELIDWFNVHLLSNKFYNVECGYDEGSWLEEITYTKKMESESQAWTRAIQTIKSKIDSFLADDLAYRQYLVYKKMFENNPNYPAN